MRLRSVELFLLPIQTRVPLKFGPETLTAVTCARARVRVEDAAGRSAFGWGETPLSVQWVWPSRRPVAERLEALIGFCRRLAEAYAGFAATGHPLDIGHAFLETELHPRLDAHNAARGPAAEPMPWLAALVCASVFDQALHDAAGVLTQRPTYSLYGSAELDRDLSAYLEPVPGTGVSFAGRYPAEHLLAAPRTELRAWHLVGGVDALEARDLTGQEPDDGYPVLLADWIRSDGLTCLKVKLRGNDAAWDYERLVRVGGIGVPLGVEWLSADFNCTVTEPGYVNAILDRLRDEQPRLYGMLLYVEQPFPYELEAHRLDVRSVAARKPLFLDESAHDWRLIRLGRELGWSGVALKTCKTQTGALLSACWARAHGMTLMVQDLSNPMLAQIPHVQLAAHVDTIMGVETNGMQFYPAASAPEARVHPGLYRRRGGKLDLRTLGGPGLGYRIADIERALPPATAAFGS